VVVAKKAPYSEIVIHCINVSLQEQQKKLAMYQKKIDKKVGLKSKFESAGIHSPDFQYFNIYKGQHSRLGCFRAIKLEDGDQESERVLDASAYESYIDQCSKKLNSQAAVAVKIEPEFYPQNYFNIGACEPQVYCRPRAGSDVIKSIVYNKMMEMSLKRQQNEEASYPQYGNLTPVRSRGCAKEFPVPNKKNLKINSTIFKPSFVPKI
jgi:hypothetical protein